MRPSTRLVVCVAVTVAACSQPETGSAPPNSASRLTDQRPVADAADANFLSEINDLHRAGRIQEGLARLEAEIERDPGRPLLYYNLGVFRASLSDYENAVLAFQEELARTPNHAGSHRALAIAYTRLGRLEESISHFERCLVADPDDALCTFDLGHNLSTLGLFDDARGYLEHAAKLRHDATGYAELGLLYRRLGDPEKAARTFSQALADDPSHLPTLLGYGQILTALGRGEDGELLLERHRHLSGLQDQLDAFERSREQSEPPAVAWADLGRLHRERDDPSAAKAAYEKALELDTTLALAAVELTALYLEDQQLSEAERTIELALAADPDNPAPTFYLGLLRLKQDQTDAAAQAFKTSLGLGSWPAQAFLDLGTAYREAGEVNGAATAYLEALRLEPQNPRVHSHLAQASYEAGERATAEKAARKAVELDPGQAAAWTLLGVLRYDAEDPQAAEKAFRRALAVERQTLLRADAETLLLESFPDGSESIDLFRRLLQEGGT